MLPRLVLVSIRSITPVEGVQQLLLIELNLTFKLYRSMLFILLDPVELLFLLLKFVAELVDLLRQLLVLYLVLRILTLRQLKVVGDKFELCLEIPDGLVLLINL